MTIQVDNAIPPNVVEIGNEITQGVVDGLMSASPAPSSSNPFFTTGGGQMTGTLIIDNNDSGVTIELNPVTGLSVLQAGISTSSLTVLNDSIYGTDMDGGTYALSSNWVGGTFESDSWQIGIAGVTFPDSTIQTTAAVSPTFATTAEAQAGTSTTTVVSPATLLDARYLAGARFIGYVTATGATSGTGASATTGFIKAVNAPTTAIGFAQSYFAQQNGQRGEIYNTGIDFRKNIVFGARLARIQAGTIDSNSIFRCNLGRTVPLTTAGDLSTRGVGIRIVGNTGALELQVHNGTSLFNVTSSFTPVYNVAFDVVITCNGAGVATLYVNGTSVATSSNAPTTLLSANASVFLVEAHNTAILTNSPMQMNCSDQFLHISSV